MRRSGSSRSLFVIGHSCPQLPQHHIMRTDVPWTVCSGRTGPAVPHCGHFAGNRSLSGLVVTGEPPAYHS